ncbi:ABC transporter substrate-binding protein [Streptomyces avidinii]
MSQGTAPPTKGGRRQIREVQDTFPASEELDRAKATLAEKWDKALS